MQHPAQELLELRPAPNVAAGESALSDAYKSLLPPVLNAALWTRKANVPALALLLQAYLRKGGVTVANLGFITPALGIFQKLLTTRGTSGHDELAFDVLVAMSEYVVVISNVNLGWRLLIFCTRSCITLSTAGSPRTRLSH